MIDMNEENNNNSNGIFGKYGGAVIGGVIALILCFTEIYRVLVYCVIVLAGVLVGNYVQKNKSIVKEKLKEFIDRF